MSPTAWLHVILFEPEIPPNTGNVIRLCANTGAQLHLIEPLGFEIGDKRLRRAGLDYHEFASLQTHSNLERCLSSIDAAQAQPTRVFALSTRGTTQCHQAHFQAGDALLFGPETRGLPQAVLDGLPPEQCLRIPLRPDNRSLNLSNAVAIMCYEAWRQQGFCGGE